MPHPAGLAYGLAVLMVAVSLYCIAWLVVATRQSRHNHVDVNVSHVAMGLGMAGMLVPRLNLLPDGVWESVFVAIAAWFSWQGVRFVTGKLSVRDGSVSHGLSHYLIHLVMALAMLYMYLAAVPGRVGAGGAMAMTGPTGAGANFVGLPLLFVVILCASAVWQVDALSRSTPSRSHPGRRRRRLGGRRRRHCSPWSRDDGPGSPARDGMSHRHVHHHGVHARPHALGARTRWCAAARGERRGGAGRR